MTEPEKLFPCRVTGVYSLDGSELDKFKAHSADELVLEDLSLHERGNLSIRGMAFLIWPKDGLGQPTMELHVEIEANGMETLMRAQQAVAGPLMRTLHQKLRLHRPSLMNGSPSGTQSFSTRKDVIVIDLRPPSTLSTRQIPFTADQQEQGGQKTTPAHLAYHGNGNGSSNGKAHRRRSPV